MVNADNSSRWKPSWRDALFYGVSSAIVAVFCYATARLVPSLPEPYWAPIAAVVVLYPDREATRRAAGQRFLGTLLGSLIGWASAWAHGNILVYGLSVLAAVGLCHLLRLDAAARLCAVAVTVITLIPRAQPAYVVAFHRFVEVSYGVACALAFTVVTDLARERWRPASSCVVRSRPRDG
jgi:uncharacterized membrane protein YccC